jgi:hypothetical protein
LSIIKYRPQRATEIKGEPQREVYSFAALNHFSAVHCGLIEYNKIQATESNRDKRRTTERSVFLCGPQSILCCPLWAEFERVHK